MSSNLVWTLLQDDLQHFSRKCKSHSTYIHSDSHLNFPAGSPMLFSVVTQMTPWGPQHLADRPPSNPSTPFPPHHLPHSSHPHFTPRGFLQCRSHFLSPISLQRLSPFPQPLAQGAPACPAVFHEPTPPTPNARTNPNCSLSCSPPRALFINGFAGIQRRRILVNWC